MLFTIGTGNVCVGIFYLKCSFYLENYNILCDLPDICKKVFYCASHIHMNQRRSVSFKMRDNKNVPVMPQIFDVDTIKNDNNRS